MATRSEILASIVEHIETAWPESAHWSRKAAEKGHPWRYRTPPRDLSEEEWTGMLVECPLCGAEPGQLCSTPTGFRAFGGHKRRNRLGAKIPA